MGGEVYGNRAATAPVRRRHRLPGSRARWETMGPCPCTATKASSCAPRSWARPTASSPCSPAGWARSAPSARACAAPRAAFGARLEPAMMVDLQCYEGRNLDTVTQAESLASWGDVLARDYTTLHRRRRDARDRRPADRGARAQPAAVPPARRRAALDGRGRARPRPGPRRLPAAGARGRRLGAELPRLRAVRRAGPAPRVQPRRRRHGVPGMPPAGLRGARRRRRWPCCALLAGDWAVADASQPRHRREGSGLAARVPAVAPRARCALVAPRGPTRPDADRLRDVRR